MRLRLQPPTRANTVQIPVDVEFQQVRRIIARTPHLVSSNALESSRLQIQAVNECINETDRVVRPNVSRPQRRGEAEAGSGLYQ